MSDITLSGVRSARVHFYVAAQYCVASTFSASACRTSDSRSAKTMHLGSNVTARHFVSFATTEVGVAPSSNTEQRHTAHRHTSDKGELRICCTRLEVGRFQPSTAALSFLVSAMLPSLFGTAVCACPLAVYATGPVAEVGAVSHCDTCALRWWLP